jgi:hypothetical protein
MRRDTLLALGIVILVLAALTAKSLMLSMPPSPRGSSEFNAERAKARLAYILGDERPHPADSAADDLVRARLVTTLRQMGLEPIVRDQTACNEFQKARLVACTRVRNVIAIIGPSRGKALLLSSHYDSVPVGPGAADDGIGVATMLEVGSILKDRPLKRPVILSRNVDSLLNFEARGVTGPVTMFETNQPNGAAIETYGDVVRRPFASSLSTDVARLIPNDTDVTTYKERGWLTLNSAITGNETHYHSPGDDLSSLDLGSLQDMGDEALALASKLSAGTPSAKANRIFFDFLGRFFIEMPLALGAGCLLFLLAAFAAIGWKRRALLSGAPVALGAIVAGSALAWLAVTIMGALRAGTYWRAHPELSFVAIYATTLLGVLVVLAALGAKLEPRRLRTGFWFLFLLLGSALALLAPGGIIYFLFPPALLLAGMILSRWYPPSETLGAFAAALLLFLTWGELLAALEELFSPGPLWIVAPVAAVIITALLIEAKGLFARSNRKALFAGSALLVLLAWLSAGIAPAYSKERQQRFTIEHLTMFPSGRSYWSILNDGAPLPRSYQQLGQWKRGKLPFSERRRWFLSGPPEPSAQPPSVEVIESLANGSERRVRLRLRPRGSERLLLIAPSEAYLRSAGVKGFVRPIGSADSQGEFTISCTGRSCDGMEMSIDLNTAKPVVFTLVGAKNGLPRSAAMLVRDRGEFARPQYTPDETVAISRVKL